MRGDGRPSPSAPAFSSFLEYSVDVGIGTILAVPPIGEVAMMTSVESLFPLTRAVRTVSVVSKHSHQKVVDSVLDAGDYDVVFMESLDRAYSHIKRVTPHLVILCLEIDDTEGLQVLSMLKLDSATSQIPVMTYLAAPDDTAAGDDWLTLDRDAFRQSIAFSMN